MLSRPRQTGCVNQQYEVCHIDVFRSRDKKFTLSIPKLTGNLFRAGRALAGLTRDDLASRAGLSRDALRSWEVSSDCIIPVGSMSRATPSRLRYTPTPHLQGTARPLGSIAFSPGALRFNGRDVQAKRRRRRHQPRRLPLAKIRPGTPAPAMGPGTDWIVKLRLS